VQVGQDMWSWSARAWRPLSAPSRSVSLRNCVRYAKFKPHGGMMLCGPLSRVSACITHGRPQHTATCERGDTCHCVQAREPAADANAEDGRSKTVEIVGKLSVGACHE